VNFEEKKKLFDDIWSMIEKECISVNDIIAFQETLELLTAKFTGKMGNHDQATYVAAHIHRHVLQLLDQLYGVEIVRTNKLWDKDNAGG
jgi:hypothetical protein